MCEEREKDGGKEKRKKMGPVVSFINPSYDFGNSVADNWEINMTKRFDRVISMAPLRTRFLDTEKMCPRIFWYFTEMGYNIKLMCKQA